MAAGPSESLKPVAVGSWNTRDELILNNLFLPFHFFYED
jgi:hypothetical protein